MTLGRWLRETVSRLSALVRVRARETDLDDELTDHLREATAYHEGRGLSPEAAARAARVSLGGLEPLREHLRDIRRPRLFADTLQDLRYGVRTLRQAPTFTAVALATLALGIGANTAVFTVLNGTLLRPMPFANPDRLLVPAFSPVAGPFQPGPTLLDLDFVPFRATQRVFEDLAASRQGVSGSVLTGAGDPVRLRRAAVTANYFNVLGLTPVVGRLFTPGEGEAGRDHVVLISSELWRGRLGGDPAVTTRSVVLDGESYRIIGVLPVDFAFPHRAEIWTPFEVRVSPGRPQLLEAIGRLRPDGSAAIALAGFEAFLRQQASTRGAVALGPEWAARLVPVADIVVGQARPPIEILAGAVTFVLLIVCANVANLVLVRASGRTRELAVRAALGASRARLLRQLLVESALLAATGGLLGLAVAAAGVDGLRAFAPLAALPRPNLVRIDGWVLAFTAGVSLVTGLAFGVAPALQSARTATRRSLRDGARGATAGRDRMRAALACGEVALALILLVGGTLLLRSFVRLESIDPGFQPDHRLAVGLTFPAASYGSPDRITAFHAALLERLAAVDGVQAAVAVNDRPLGTTWTVGDFTLQDGRALPTGWAADKVSVSAGYFRTMGIPILAGREFTTADDGHAAGVVLISASVAHTLWSDRSPLGRQIAMTEHPTAADWLTIVGVVADVHQQTLDRGAQAATYVPLAQTREPAFLNHATFIVQTQTEPEALRPAIRAAVHAVDPNLPIETLAPLPDLIAGTLATPRFQASLVGIFALIALTLAAIGISGVISYSVSERTREIGVRIALGASSAQVLAMVARQTVTVIAVGVACGVVGAWMLTQALGSVLYEIRPHDPAAFGAAVGVLVVAALAGAAGPAWRARSVSPIVALRSE